MTKSTCWVICAVVLLGCSKERRCKTLTDRGTSDVAKRVFHEAHCQGGGVTWAGLMGVVLTAHGRREPMTEPSKWSGDVSRLTLLEGGTAIVSIDEEGSSARLCTDHEPLAKAAFARLDELNRDEAELRAALAKADPLSVECFSRPIVLPTETETETAPAPDPVSPNELTALLTTERVWCDPSGDLQVADRRVPVAEVTRLGRLEFELDGGGRHTFEGREVPLKWHLMSDGRVELQSHGLHHLSIVDAAFSITLIDREVHHFRLRRGADCRR